MAPRRAPHPVRVFVRTDSRGVEVVPIVQAASFRGLPTSKTRFRGTNRRCGTGCRGLRELRVDPAGARKIHREFTCAVHLRTNSRGIPRTTEHELNAAVVLSSGTKRVCAGSPPSVLSSSPFFKHHLRRGTLERKKHRAEPGAGSVPPSRAAPAERGRNKIPPRVRCTVDNFVSFFLSLNNYLPPPLFFLTTPSS